MPPPTILPQTFHSDRRRNILLHKPCHGNNLLAMATTSEPCDADNL